MKADAFARPENSPKQFALFNARPVRQKDLGIGTGEAAALLAVGGCQIRLHRYSAGFKTSTRAKELALQAGDLTTAGRADVNISSIYTQLGDFEGAKATAEEAANYLQNSPRRDYFAMSLAARGEIEFGLDHNKSGENSLRRALAVAKEARTSRGRRHRGSLWHLACPKRRPEGRQKRC